MTINVIKRNGVKESLQYEKLHRMVDTACEGLEVSAAHIETNSRLQMYEGITTKQIQDVLVNSASSLITEEQPDYQYAAARLLLFSLIKDIFGANSYPHLKDVIDKNIFIGLYDPTILNDYTEKEIDQLNSFIDHKRDLEFTYAGLSQMIDKYLLQDRSTGQVYETPQFAYMMIAATIFKNYPQTTRLKYVKNFYDAISQHYISLPTPILGGVRTPKRGFASCMLIESDDTLASIGATDEAILRYTAHRAGIGLDLSRIRAINSKIRNGEVSHTGVVPFIKKMVATTLSCTQNGIRGGASTISFPIWHKEIESIIVLKNNKGSEDNRERRADYSIKISQLFYERFINNKNITLFSPHDVPLLNDYFGMPEFDELYIKYENDESIPKTTIGARELFTSLMNERADTGRIYITNIDQFNSHSSFSIPVKMTNLCCMTEDQRVVTEKGLLTVKELYESKESLELFNNTNIVNATEFLKLRENEPVYKLNTKQGYNHTITSDHKVHVVNKGWTELKDIVIGDKIHVQSNEGVFGDVKEEELAFLNGLYQADGTQTEGKVCIDIYSGKTFKYEDYIKSCFNNIYEKHNLSKNITTGRIHEIPKFRSNQVSINSNHTKKRIESSKLKSLFSKKGEIPDFVWKGTKETVGAYLKGLYLGDGTVATGGSNVSVISLTSIDKPFLLDLQVLLSNLGINSCVTISSKAGKRLMPDGKGGKKEYHCKESYRILITNYIDCKRFNDLTGFIEDRGQELPERELYEKKGYAEVTSIEKLDNQDVYCCEVNDESHSFIANGVITHNCEISLPTKPLNHIDDENGRIALCMLSAINMGKFKDNHQGFKSLEKYCDLTVRAIEEIIDMQDYPVKAAENSTKKGRYLGVGLTNLAYYLAKHKLKYGDDGATELCHRFFEAFQYYLLKSSNTLAKERGKCEWFNETKYSQGILPIDTYKKSVDDVCKQEYILDWEGLRKEVVEHGLRHSTLSAQMPCESSSVCGNTTNGVDKVRSLMTVKQSRRNSLPVLMPDQDKYKNYYDLLWDQKDNIGFINVLSVLQKFLDQSISTNLSYNPSVYPDRQVPMSTFLKELLYSYKMGLKTLYYHNTMKDTKSFVIEGDTESDKVTTSFEEVEDCPGGACKL